MKTTDQTLKDLQKRLQSMEVSARLENVGRVEEVGDNVVKVSGLSKVAMGEIVEFADRSLGFAFNLDEDSISVILLGKETGITPGSQVKKSGRFLSIGAGDDLLGRVINPLGEALDGQGKVVVKKYMPLEKIAAGVVERQSVDTPLFT